MTNPLKRAGMVIALLVALAACSGTQPVYNVESAPVPYNSHALSFEQVGGAIKSAVRSENWIINAAQPGELRCSYSWKDHVAAVTIHYTQSSYSIELASSTNLNESDGRIHRKYNALVHRLKNTIDRRLSQAI